MIGKFISGTIRVATLPLDAVSIVGDLALGRDGSKESRTDEDAFPIISTLERVRDLIAEAAEDIDN